MSPRTLFATLASAAGLAFAFPVLAQETANESAKETDVPALAGALERRAKQVVGLMNGEPEAPFAEIFTSDFLAQVPPAQLVAISDQLTGQFGPALAVAMLEPSDATRARLEVRMERAIAKGAIGIDPTQGNRINELLFNDFEPVDDSVEKIEADLAALPGEVGVWYGPVANDAPVFALNAEEPFAIGSAFKLYVLAALDIDIAEGKRSWDDVVELDARSFPSGILQDWPEGAPLTLHTLASLMMSLSDNTATDQLIDIVGRERVAQVMRNSGHSAPELNTPFLKTRELFLLKGGDPARLSAYRAADAEEKRTILAGLEGEDIDLAALAATFDGNPIAIDVEWLASPNDLRNLFRYMFGHADPRGFETISINPALPDALLEDWSAVGYKGGSEPGVLNLTWLLRDDAGEWYTLILSWNNPDAPVDHSTLELIAQRILSLPR